MAKEEIAICGVAKEENALCGVAKKENALCGVAKEENAVRSDQRGECWESQEHVSWSNSREVDANQERPFK